MENYYSAYRAGLIYQKKIGYQCEPKPRVKAMRSVHYLGDQIIAIKYLDGSGIYFDRDSDGCLYGLRTTRDWHFNLVNKIVTRSIYSDTKMWVDAIDWEERRREQNESKSL